MWIDDRTPKIQEEVEEEAPTPPRTHFLKRQRCRIRIDFSTHKLLLIGSKLIFSAPTSRPSRVHRPQTRGGSHTLPSNASSSHVTSSLSPMHQTLQLFGSNPAHPAPPPPRADHHLVTSAQVPQPPRRCSARCMAPQAPACSRESARPPFRRNCSLAPSLHQQPALGVVPREVSIRARIKRSCARNSSSGAFQSSEGSRENGCRKGYPRFRSEE